MDTTTTGDAGGAGPVSGSGARDVRPAPRMLRLARIEEEVHHWYEESEIGRHLPQLVDVCDLCDADAVGARTVERAVG